MDTCKQIGSVSNHKNVGTATDPASTNIKKLAIVGLAVTALFATVFLCSGCSPDSPEEMDVGVKFANVDQNIVKCDDVAVINDPVLISSNLGINGPDVSEREGMIYNASLFMKDDNGNFMKNNVKVEIHAVGDYDVHDEMAALNGIHRKFYSILIKSGTSLKFTISVYDEDGHRLILPYFSISFFDLDTAAAGKSKEYVIAEGFTHYYVSANSSVKTTKDGRRTKFSASLQGTRFDNPEEVEYLTIASKAKGVTLQYQNRNEVTLTVGAEDGNKAAADYHRGFIFSLHPSLLCAKTLLTNGKQVDPADTSTDGVEWPLMDGVEPTPYMLAPIIHTNEDGLLIT